MTHLKQQKSFVFFLVRHWAMDVIGVIYTSSLEVHYSRQKNCASLSRPAWVNDWVRLAKYDSNQLRVVDSIENHLDRIVRVSTVSNAALRSSKTRRDTLPLSRKRTRSLWTDRRAVLVEWNGRYTDCRAGRRLNVVRCSRNRSATTCSISFDR